MGVREMILEEGREIGRKIGMKEVEKANFRIVKALFIVNS
jgi:hypothetical protein